MTLNSPKSLQALMQQLHKKYSTFSQTTIHNTQSNIQHRHNKKKQFDSIINISNRNQNQDILYHNNGESKSIVLKSVLNIQNQKLDNYSQQEQEKYEENMGKEMISCGARRRMEGRVEEKVGKGEVGVCQLAVENQELKNELYEVKKIMEQQAQIIQHLASMLQ